MNLPAGEYELIALVDRDNNGFPERSEVVGKRHVDLNLDTASGQVLTDFNIKLSSSSSIDWDISIPIPKIPTIEKSLFYPQGTIRNISDPIFGPELSTLGLYDPPAFQERAPTMFYALEEFIPYKIPVIFVHGISGTVWEFVSIIEEVDRERYVPWFYYYPSGSDPDGLAENFYRLFLSGELFPKTDTPMIVVAHSMGGLIVRESMNLHQGSQRGNTVALLITIASPFAGHPAAASGVKNAPMIIPSWCDLNPEGEFIRRLFRKPLSTSINHQFLYAYTNPDALKLGENSDGVVPLYSQLHPLAQEQSTRSIGFNSSHVGILRRDAAIHHIIEAIQSVKGFYPDSHVRAMQAGGYDIELDDSNDDREKYVIQVLGKYLAALSSGKLEPVTPFQRHFIWVSQGKVKANKFAEKAWERFVQENPGVVETP